MTAVSFGNSEERSAWKSFQKRQSNHVFIESLHSIQILDTESNLAKALYRGLLLRGDRHWYDHLVDAQTLDVVIRMIAPGCSLEGGMTLCRPWGTPFTRAPTDRPPTRATPAQLGGPDRAALPETWRPHTRR